MVAVALLALALWVPGTLYPPSDVSHTIFRTAVCLAAVKVAWPESRIARWGLLLWAGGIAWSVVAAPDPWRAVWSTQNRNEGAWQAAHYLVLVLVAGAIGRDRLAHWVAIGAGLSAAWGFAPMGWVNGRLAGATGNPLYLAPLLVVGVWAAYRAGWPAMMVILAACAALTGSKGVLVALIAAGGVAVVAKAPRLAFACAVCLAGALWLVPIPDSGLIRLELGRVAALGIWEEPFGWGAEGFPFVWDRFWGGASATGEAWHDRAHSLVIDRAVEWGLVGVAGWVAVVVAAWRRAELPERMAIAAYVGFGMTMFEMMWGGAAFACLLGYTLRGRAVRLGKTTWVAAAVALVVGSLGLAQSWAAAHAATMPAMERAIEMPSPIGGDLVELYLKAQQTRATLGWAAKHVELRSPHATQQAFLLAAWDRRYCVDLRAVAPKRPDVKSLCDFS